MALEESGNNRLFKSVSDISIIIHTNQTIVPNFQGFTLQSVSGDILTGTQSFTDLDKLASHGIVRYIELPQKYTPMLDLSAVDVNVLPVWQGDLDQVYQGEDVLVGIYDTGIDFTHPDFIDEDGKSRILYLWDQTDNAGPEPSGFNYYGTEYSQSDINDEIDGTPAGQIRQVDIYGHGTHVAGIAAGDGSQYRGMAPKSNLIIVKGGNREFENSQIIDGLGYMFQRANELNRPIVVNLSLGSQEGAHDGTDALEKAIDNYLWDPARAVVVSAGNSGSKNIHAKGEWLEGESDPVEVTFNVPNNPSSSNDYFLFDVWSPASMQLKITIVTPQDEVIGPVPTGSESVWPSRLNRMVIVDNASEGASPLNNDSHLSFQIRDVEIIAGNIDNFPQGTWTFRFEGNPGTFHLWMYEQSEAIQGEIIQGVDRSVLISSPGNSRSAITVGAHISRESHLVKSLITTGDLASFSSPGPTRTGSWKPELTAPGQYIIAPFSKDTETWPSEGRVTSDTLYRSWQGTSMSAPHVTGIVALMLEADPEMNASDIRLKLIQSCNTDASTGEVWNSDWGYGKVNAEKVMQNLTAVHTPNPVDFKSVCLVENYPNPFNGQTTIRWHFTETHSSNKISIYDSRGRMVYQSLTTETVFQWDAKNQNQETLAAGLYIVQISSGIQTLSKKMLLLP